MKLMDHPLTFEQSFGGHLALFRQWVQRPAALLYWPISNAIGRKKMVSFILTISKVVGKELH